MGDQIYRDFTLDGGVMTPTARYTHAGAADGALAAIDGGPGYTLSQRRFFQADMLGTTRLVTDAAGSISQALAFTAFGEPLGTPPTGSPRYGYAGAWGYQADRLATPTWTGPAALHVGARYYDPALGRFLGRDPMGIFGGLSTYVYCHANGGAGIDPSGEMSLVGQITTSAVIGGLASGLTNGVQSGSWDWKDAGVGALGGAVGGPLGLVNPALGGAVGSGITSYLSGHRGWKFVGVTLGGAILGYLGHWVGFVEGEWAGAFWRSMPIWETNVLGSDALCE